MILLIHALVDKTIVLETHTNSVADCPVKDDVITVITKGVSKRYLVESRELTITGDDMFGPYLDNITVWLKEL